MCFNLFTLVPAAPDLPGEPWANDLYKLQTDQLIAAWRWWSFGLNVVVVLYCGVAFALVLTVGAIFLARSHSVCSSRLRLILCYLRICPAIGTI